MADWAAVLEGAAAAQTMEAPLPAVEALEEISVERLEEEEGAV